MFTRKYNTANHAKRGKPLVFAARGVARALVKPENLSSERDRVFLGVYILPAWNRSL